MAPAIVIVGTLVLFPDMPSKALKRRNVMEIFARFVAILLVGALPALCISLAKTTAKVVGKTADSVVVSKVG